MFNLLEPISEIYIAQVKLYNYRNYQALSLKGGEGHLVLWGHNGAGKTNFLEALSLLAPGKGLRGAKYSELWPKNHKAEQIAIYADLASKRGTHCSIGTGFSRESAVRRVKINNEFCAMADLWRYCQMVWLIPAMDGLFTGAPSDRRLFFDRIVASLNPPHLDHLRRYNWAVKTRNRLLCEDYRDSSYFNSIEQKIADYGLLIAAARLEALGLIEQIMADLADDLSFPQAQLSLVGELEQALLDKEPDKVREQFIAYLTLNREQDRQAGRTSRGPHLSDLMVFYLPKAMPAALCSTGEQKSLLILLILAHICLICQVVKITPILLLDEVAAHLDKGRRQALFALLERLEVQAVLTGTDRFLFSELKNSAIFYEVRNNNIYREEP